MAISLFAMRTESPGVPLEIVAKVATACVEVRESESLKAAAYRAKFALNKKILG